jgi:lathosterol oxidase
METIFKMHEALTVITLLEFARYFVFAGIAYWAFYYLGKDKWLHKKIQKRFPKNENIMHEIKYSIINMVMFTLLTIGTYWLKINGYTQMYDHIEDYGVPYFVLSIVLMIILHDTYFYWAHRFMHLKKIYPHVHLIHHHSINPTPFAAYSFHPYEGFLQVIILPIFVLTIPTHVYAVLIWLTFSIIENVAGHLGYELFKPGFTKHKLKGLSNTVTHHNMHHSHFNYNYGLYFNFWDQLMNTNHEKYHDTFEKIARTEKPSDNSVSIS